MIQLQRHIEILLLENECVIVPDFGGFMTHQVSARYDEADRSFLPPVRTLGFNPQLRMNDSVLVQSYVEAYDISYPEALRRIEAEVAELKQTLQEKGSYDMEDLGTLSVNHEGNYEFAPCEAGILSPELYGLGNFQFKRLKDEDIDETASIAAEPVAKQVPLQPALLEFTGSDDDDNRAITIKMSWIRNAVAVAAAVVAFFFIATPVTNSDLNTQAMSQLQHHLLYKLIPQDTNIVPAITNPSEFTENAEGSEISNSSENSDFTEKTDASASSKPSATTYCVIVASQVKMSNAEQYANKLHKQGLEEAKVFVYNNVVRVMCGEYQTQEEAYRQVNKLNNKEEFADAWVLKVQK